MRRTTIWSRNLIACTIGALLVVLNLTSRSSAAEVNITDIAGREVKLVAPAKRILLDAPLYYSALSLISKNAADLIVGISDSPSGLNFGREPEMVQDLIAKPRIGSIWRRTFSIEKALELKPDLLIAGRGARGQAAAIEGALAKAGVPTIYVDFSADPVRNTVPSIEIIGNAIGAEHQAAEFVDFYRRHVDRIADRLKATDLPRPTLLILSRGPGVRCCFAASNSSATAYFGGRGMENIADSRKQDLSGGAVQLSLEYIIDKDPDALVVQAVGTGPDSVFGEPPTLTQGVASLEKLRSEPGFRDLSAVQHGRVHAIDLSILISPLSFVAFEALAKWVHPELFADIDPQATLDEINRRFLKTPLKGPFWVSLDPAADRASSRRP